ncbi:hypothetical protein BJX61DRAFT_512154 [Aspergillus egyptiacus]|nr:hypothetical protein BJX61DRAFT_512154 [Aspergillus egyptiacus]
MSSPPIIPERISSLMNPDRLALLSQQRQRSASAMSQLSQLSAKSAVSDFLETKLVAMEEELQWIRMAKDGLDEVKAKDLISDEEFVEQMEPFLEAFRKTSERLRVHKRQERFLDDDLHEVVEAKRHRSGEPDESFLERAYTSTMVSRVMTVSAKQGPQRFNTSEFRKKVEAYYWAPGQVPEEFSWCHVLGFLPREQIKVAHLVPKSLSGEELAHLFGVGEMPAYDPRNSITLQKGIERRLDQGKLLIVPIPGKMTTPTRWKCVIVNDADLDEIFYVELDGKIIRGKDLNGKELTFLSESRPARRFLYFRFLISYLYAKRRGDTSVKEKVDATRFWPTMGRYLNRSTLVTMARCISGCDLPPSFVEGSTFELEGDQAEQKSTDAGMVLSAQLRDAMLDSMRVVEASKDGDMSDSEEEK